MLQPHIRKAGRTGRARGADLRRVAEEIRGRQARLGPDAVRLAWVKAHVGTRGNESVDQLAKEWADLPEEGVEKVLAEGGL